MAQSPEDNAGNSEVIRYDLGWNAINAMLRAGRSLSGHERNCCFLNTGGTRFANVSAASGLDYADDGRVLSLADWDYDGDIDLWIANRSGPQVRYLRNNHEHEVHRVSFRLTGKSCNRDAIGAKVVLRWKNEPGVVMTQTVRSSGGYLSQSSKWIHFGLGARDTVDQVVVTWPNGKQQTFSDITANQWYDVREGESPATWDPPSFTSLKPGELNAPRLTDKARIVLLQPIPLPELRYSSRDGSNESVTDDIEKTRLINLWATWCRPCHEELQAWKESADLLGGAGVQVIAVNADERDGDVSIDEVQAVAQKMQLPFEHRFADAQLVEYLDVIQRSLLSRQRPLPLPSSFLIDRDGNLRVVYKGPVDAETIAADARLVDADSDQILLAALPFRGRWLNRPIGSTPLQLAVKLIEGAYQDEAISYIHRVMEAASSDNEGSASLSNLLGGLLTDRKEYQAAAKAFARTLELQPNNRTANIELGTLLLGINRGAAAEQKFRNVLKATPDDPELIYKLGVSLLQQNRLREAGKLMQRVVRLREDPMAYWQMGEILVRMNRIENAVKSYEKALELRPTLGQEANNLAWILATSKKSSIRDPKRALTLAQMICSASQSSDANELDTLAAAFAADGNFTDAANVAVRAIGLAQEKNNPDLVKAIESRLELYKKSKAYRE